MTIEMSRLSYSRLDLFRSCQRSFYKKYVEKAEPENPTSDYFAEFGSICHAVLETHAQAKGIIPKDVMFNMFVNGTESRDGMLKGFNQIEWPKFYGKTTMRDRYWQQGVEFVNKMPMRDVSKVIGVEVEFSFSLGDGIPNVTGFIDKVERDEYGLIVTDFKSSKTYDQAKCDAALQMSTYGVACLELYGEIPYKYVYDFIRFDEQVITHRTMEQLEQAKLYMIDTWYEINNTDFPPAYDAFFCDNFCAYKVNCPLFAQMKQLEAEKRAAKQQAKGRAKK